MKKRQFIASAVALAMASLMGAAHAAEPIKLAGVLELTGSGATPGKSFMEGVELAVKEVNATGGILGSKLEFETKDTASQGFNARKLTREAVDAGAFAVMGPVTSGSIMLSQVESKKAEVPNFTGGESALVTKQSNPYIFRTAFGQDFAMPKVANYMSKEMKLKKVGVVFANNEYGRNGRDAFSKSFQEKGGAVSFDIGVDSGEKADYASVVAKAKAADIEALFVYLNEDESIGLVNALKKDGFNKPLVGETNLTAVPVIEKVGAAMNGAIAHVGITAEAQNPTMKAFRAKFEKEFKATPDHNAVKGYTAVYMLKAGIEKAGKIDRKEAAKALHGMKISAAQYPGVIFDVKIDNNGDIVERESFIVEAKNGKQVIKAVLAGSAN